MRHFLDPKKDIAIVQLVRDFDPRGSVFFVGIAAVRRSLRDDPDLGGILLDPFALGRRQRHPVVGRHFAFAQ